MSSRSEPLQVVIEMNGPGTNLKEQQIEANIEQRVSEDVSVELRQGRFNSDLEAVATFGGGLVTERQVIMAERAVRQEIIDQNVTLQVNEWRVEQR